MAYLVFSSAKGEEIGRRRLEPSEPLTVGRSGDCDVCLHDILLSRRHCRIESTPQGWTVSDLGSKNGTLIDGQRVTRHVLKDGETFRAGRFFVRFRSGSLAASEERREKLTRPRRPADPFEAMAGTVAGVKYEPPPEDAVDAPPAPQVGTRSFEQFPTPQPTMADSGRFITADMWAEAEAARAATAGGLPLSPPVRPIAPPGNGRKPVDDSGISAALDHSVSRDLRPRSPDGAEVSAPAPAALPGPPPRPPRLPMRLRFTPLLRALGQRLRRPFTSRAAVLLASAAALLQ